MISKFNSSKSSLTGFTLIEMLIAVAIFAFISVISYSALNQLIKNVNFFRKKDEEKQQIQLVNKVLTDDLFYIVNRPVNTFNGPKLALIINNPAESDAESNTKLLEFTRNGIPKIGIKKETGFKRISYIIEDNTVKRGEFSHLDYREEPTNYVSILDNVESFKTEILNSSNIWTNKWTLRGLPQAIRITISIYQTEE